MIIKTSTLPFACGILLLAFGSCRKTPDQTYAQSGLHANRVYYCDTVLHDHPVRLFSHEGEIKDTAVISGYFALHSYLTGAPYTPGEMHPANIFSTPTRTVQYNGLVPYTASLNNGVLDLRQQDTSWESHGTPGGPIDELYNYEQSYEAMRDAALEMHDSYTRLERVDLNNYSMFESLHVSGRYTNEVIELPYTFVASRVMQRSYPFAVKANAAPQVPVGDTLMIQEGRVEFRIKQ